MTVSAVDQSDEGVVGTLFQEKVMPRGERAEIVGEITAARGRESQSPDAGAVEFATAGHRQEGE